MRKHLSACQIVFSCVVITAWFTVSNHCALALALTAKPTLQAACEHCHDSDAPGHDRRPAPQSCCKNLPAATLPTATATVAPGASIVAYAYFFVGAPLAADDTRLGSAAGELDTGPPGAESFAVAILQRSLLAHAPPFALS